MKYFYILLLTAAMQLSATAQVHQTDPPHKKGDTLPQQTDDLHGDSTKSTSMPFTAYSSIQFEFDSSVLKVESYPVLDATAAQLKASQSVCELDGFASSEGDAAHNMRLAKDRANSVKTYLVNSGVSPQKLKVKAFGETHPIADNATEMGRVLNRRVEFKKK